MRPETAVIMKHYSDWQMWKIPNYWNSLES